MRVAFGAIGSALTSAHRNSRPCITASDVPALNLLHLPSTRSTGLSRSPSISFGGADDASSSPSYPEPPSSSRFRPTFFNVNQVNVDCSIRSSLCRRPANRSAPRRVAPLSRNQTSARSPS